jgi:hypothetical protein
MSRRHPHPHPHDGTPGPAVASDGLNTNMPLHARECTEHCMFAADGPGRLMSVRQLELEGQVNKWRGGIALGIRVIASFMAVLALIVAWSAWSFRTATRQIVTEELDRRLGAIVDHVARKVESRLPWEFPAAEAQPMLDHRYLPGVPPRGATGAETKRRKTP